MLSLLYLMAHIDRANIGNAKIEGMIEDLGMSGVQYNVVLAICEYQLENLVPNSVHHASHMMLRQVWAAKAFNTTM